MRPGQIAPGVWASDQGISGVALPSPSGMPNGPRRMKNGRARASQNGEPIAEIFDAARFAELNGEIYAPVDVTSALVLQGPASLRNMLGFRNSSTSATAIVYIAFGGAATLSSWLYLAQNQMILFDAVVPQDDVYAISNESAAQLTIVQSTTPGSM